MKKITKEQIVPLLLDGVPRFKPVIEDLNLHYAVGSQLAEHLLQSQQNNKIEEFPQLAKLIEEMCIYGDSYVQNFAVIGILESIQNIWGNNKTDPEFFSAFLAPISLHYWKSLNNFWAGKIPYVKDPSWLFFTTFSIKQKLIATYKRIIRSKK